MDRDPEVMAELWQGLRAAAREELASGHRTARALDWDGHPWDLAAEAFGDYLAWIEQLHMQAATEVNLERNDLERHGAWKPQRIGSAEAMEHSARMADRAHERLLRTLKALGNLRRPGPVHVHQAAQVNVGAQQVIVAQVGQEKEA